MNDEEKITKICKPIFPPEFKQLSSSMDNRRPKNLNHRLVQHIILDWSGVLANDLEVTRNCQLHILSSYGSICMSPDEWKNVASMDWQSLFQKYIPQESISKAFEEYRRCLKD